MATTKPKTKPAAAAAPAPAPAPAAALLPTRGGCWVRNPDGTLSPEQPAELAADAAQSTEEQAP